MPDHLDPHGREPQRAAQHAFDDHDRADALDGHRRLAVLEQPAADPQPAAVAGGGEACERDDRARDRQQPRERQQPRQRERPLVRGVRDEADGVALGVVAGDVLGELPRARQQRQDHADLAGRQSGEQEVGAAEPPLGDVLDRRRGRRDQPAQGFEVRLGDRLEHDLAARPAAARLHVNGVHAEQPLDDALLAVERLHAAVRDVGLLGAEEAAAPVDAGPVDPPPRRAPPHVAGDPGDRDADRGIESAGLERAGVEPVAEDADDDEHQQRQRALADRLGHVDTDRRLVQAPRLRAHRRSGPARRSARAAARRRAS
jgi:hypothetical protein